jgi:hypothetical protein
MKRRRLQPQGVTLPRSNPAVKLLTPAPHAQDIDGTSTDDGGVVAKALAVGGHVDVSTSNDTVVLESSDEKKVNDDDNF